MPSKRIARSKVWATLGALVALAAALVVLVVYVIAPAVGKHPTTPQPTLLTIHGADPSYSILATAVSPDGSLWFTEEQHISNGGGFGSGPAKIGRVTPDGKLAEYPLAAGNTLALHPIASGSLIVGSDGNLWFVEVVGGLVHTAAPRMAIARIDPSGNIVDYVLPFATSLFFWPPVSTPIVLGPDGNIWFGVTVATHIGTTPDTTTAAEELAHITPIGTITVVPLTQLPKYASYAVDGRIIVGSDGNFWAQMDQVGSSAAITDFDIARITPAGVVTLFPPPTAGASVHGYVEGSDGNLWFTESAPDGLLFRVARITPAGQITDYPLPTPQSSLTPQSFLAPVLVRNRVKLWFVTETISCSSTPCPRVQSQIGRITPAGAITQYPAPTDSDVAWLYNGPDGNLYYVGLSPTAQVGSDRLGRIAPSGQFVEYSVPTHTEGDK